MDIALSHLQPQNHLKCELKFVILKITVSQLMDIALPHLQKKSFFSQPQNHPLPINGHRPIPHQLKLRIIFLCKMIFVLNEILHPQPQNHFTCKFKFFNLKLKIIYIIN